MEEKSLVVRKNDIFSKLRLLLVSIFKSETKTTQPRDIKVLKQEYEAGKITLGDFSEEELKEYNKLLENEVEELVKRELYLDYMLNMAK